MEMAEKKANIDLSGIFPPIPTPFKTDGEDIDYEKLKENFDKWNSKPFKGYVVMGTNGESVYMSESEKISMVVAARRLANKNQLIIAGSGCESTMATINLSNEMAKAGADALLILTPCYFKSGMNTEALYQHYIKVADSIEKPLILYNMPGNTGIDMDSNLVTRLSEHPNIIGLKDSGGDLSKMADIVYKTRDSQFQVLAGSAGFLYPALALGSVGGICALANVLGDEVCRLYELFIGGHMDEAVVLQQKLVEPGQAVTRRYSVPGLKHSLDCNGFYGGPCRSPLRSLNGIAQKEVEQAFIQNGFDLKSL
ncbi:hypothetical protein HELRODRAFT_157064 [Helobdella robusta]|uniref:4-hydroxy-2-oxoglutarate aldolase, mitochondrial n=1 Tax=Helobdella robusta TaxID=6412 RepID=T1EM58_HELRO|nr:hypothetical protein HELRODRAFT_157064 [Helobdella robusta]ESO03624.1 hypothetical protein HELRODRAFT_157064 [Helobdella robusta]